MYGLFEPLVYTIYAAIAIGCVTFVYKKCEPRRSKIFATLLVAVLFLVLPVKSAWEDHVRESYFAEACRSESGEFIYKIAKNVEGVYEMKSDFLLTHRSDNRHALVQSPYGKYQFREIDNLKAGDRYKRFYKMANGLIKDGKKVFTQYPVERSSGLIIWEDTPDVVGEEQSAVLKSNYGYGWKNATTNRDAEHRVARSELVVRDLQTGETLALKRFISVVPINGTAEEPWRYPSTCSGSTRRRVDEFLYSVLQPKI